MLCRDRAQDLQVDALRNEIEIQCNLDHPHVARLYEYRACFISRIGLRTCPFLPVVGVFRIVQDGRGLRPALP